MKIHLFERRFSVFNVSAALNQEGVLKTGLSSGGVLFQFPPIVLPSLRMLKLRSYARTHLKTKVRITIQLIPHLRIKRELEQETKKGTLCVYVLKLLHFFVSHDRHWFLFTLMEAFHHKQTPYETGARVII